MSCNGENNFDAMKNISDVTHKVLALSLLPGVGPSTLRELSKADQFKHSSISSLCEFSSRLSRAIKSESDWEHAQDLAQQQADQAKKYGARIISALDEEYPHLLRRTKDDPFVLFVKGVAHSDSKKSVAIIGTREPTCHGEVIAQRISEYFVEEGWSVVSGLALGCDAIAHKAVVQAKGHTVAVLAHGLHTVAPAGNKGLARDILDSGGLLVSAFPFGIDPRPQHFVKRDLTQAGLAAGVVLIQSDLAGGSLHASRASLKYGRWLAVPEPTVQDKKANAPKIQANMLIATGSSEEVVSFLKCEEKDLSRLVLLKSKEDYGRMLLDTNLSTHSNTQYDDESPLILTQFSLL